MRDFFQFVPLFIVAMIVAEYLWFTRGGFCVDVAGFVILAFVGFCGYEVDYLFRKIWRKYVREWRESHPGV